MFAHRQQVLIVAAATVALLGSAAVGSVLDYTSNRNAKQGQLGELSGLLAKLFGNLLKVNTELRSFADGELTLFAPLDNAMDEFDGRKGARFIANHMVNLAVEVADLESATNNYKAVKLSSLAPGNPPLFLNRDSNVYYVNGAMIWIRDQDAESVSGKPQFLHVIDRVLQPIELKRRLSSSSSASKAFVGLTAGKLLREHEKFDLDKHSISKFSKRVKDQVGYDIFDMPGHNTFFIPVDAAFEEYSLDLLSPDVIRSHVVPDHVVFSRPANYSKKGEKGKKEPYHFRTQTFVESDSGMEVDVIVKINGGGESATHVKSFLVKGSSQIARGHSTVSRILRSDIAVDNGVVHLIDKPLAVTNIGLLEYLESPSNANQLGRFAHWLGRRGGSLKQMIRDTPSGTVFAPSNAAFTATVESALDRDPAKAEQILGLHFVDQWIAGDDIRIHMPQNGQDVFSASVPYPEGMTVPRQLWLYHNNDSGLVVDGMGTAAAVEEADIGVTNGVVHVIDRVMGLPAQTVYQKVAQDPMMQSAFSLGNQDHFNEQLSRTDRRFTYLVASNAAWEELKTKYSTAHKQLFMGYFGYQSRMILERHFLLGESLTVSDLVARTEEKGSVGMMRGVKGLEFYKAGGDTEGEEEYYIVTWGTITARILRPDLHCTNGYVHVIDKVLMSRGDVVVNEMRDAGETTVRANVFTASITAAIVISWSFASL